MDMKHTIDNAVHFSVTPKSDPSVHFWIIEMSSVDSESFI